MKFRNQFLKYQLHAEGEGDGGGDGGIPSATGGGSAPASSAPGNNDGDNVTDYSKLWSNSNNSNGQSQQPSDSSNGQQPTQQPGVSSFEEHLQSLPLQFNAQQFLEAANAGNLEGLQEMMVGMQRDMYKTMLLDANKVIQQRVQQALDQANQNTQSTLQTDKVLSRMHAELPFTKSPAYEPLARAVVTQFLKNGKTADEAIQEAGNFFKTMATDVTGVQSPDGKPNGGFNGNFGGHDNRQQESQPDWVSFISGVSTDN